MQLFKLSLGDTWSRHLFNHSVYHGHLSVTEANVVPIPTKCAFDNNVSATASDSLQNGVSSPIFLAPSEQEIKNLPLAFELRSDISLVMSFAVSNTKLLQDSNECLYPTKIA